MNDGLQWVPLLSSLAAAAAVVLGLRAAVPLWDKLTATYVADLTKTIRALNIDQSKIPWMLRAWGLAMVGAVVLLWPVAGMPPLAIAAAVLIYFAPRLWLRLVISRRQTSIRDQLVGATVALANAARAGLSLAQGLDVVAKETPNPLGRELQRIVSDFRHGRPLADALLEAKTRLNLDSFSLFSAAVLTAIERGGRITVTLERLSTSLQENQRLERKLESDTAAGRMMVFVLAIFPAAFLGISLLINREGTVATFQSLTGQVLMTVVIILVYMSVRWSNKIINIEV